MKYMPKYPIWKSPVLSLCGSDHLLKAAAGEEFQEHHMLEAPSLVILVQVCSRCAAASWYRGWVPFPYDVAGAPICLGEQSTVSRLSPR